MGRRASVDRSTPSNDGTLDLRKYPKKQEKQMLKRRMSQDNDECSFLRCRLVSFVQVTTESRSGNKHTAASAVGVFLGDGSEAHDSEISRSERKGESLRGDGGQRDDRQPLV